MGYVERNGFAASTLVARMEDTPLDPAPVWDDLATFDGRPYRGKLDWVTSGLPCQPYSVAGPMRDEADERALWPHFVRIVRECAPAALFLENVPRFQRFFEPAWRQLRELGFVFAPPLLATASHYGAPHVRRRLYILAAHPSRTGLEELTRQPADAGSKRATPQRSVASAAHPDRTVCAPERSGWLFNLERETFRHHVNGCGAGCCVCPSPWADESPAARMDDGPADWMDRTRATGEGVIPLVVAEALRLLAAEWRRENVRQ